VNKKRKGDEVMRSFTATWVLSVGRLMILVPVFVLSQGAQAQWHATVGAQTVDQGRQALAFLPNELWIHQGDSIMWNFDAGEIHTVTFLSTVPTPQIRPPFDAGCPGFSSAPATFDGSTCVTTPPLVAGATFTVSFPAVGNFKLVCLVHPDMTAVIHVLDPSQPLPHTQDFYDQEAKDQAQALLSDEDSNASQNGDESAHHHAGHRVTAGIGEISTTAAGAQTLSVLRFTEDNMTIHAGQTVEWENDDPEDPHTITFGTEPVDLFDPSANVTVDADGALHAVINSTSDKVHSGFILAAPQERVGLPQSPLFVTRFRITFTHPGTFPYSCALHDNLGMKGHITVVP
jgi:plastocyanin